MGVCVSCTLLHISVQETHVVYGCICAPVTCVCIMYTHIMCECVCAMRYRYVGAILPFLCSQGLGSGWLENQGRQNGDLELGDSASGVG